MQQVGVHCCFHKWTAKISNQNGLTRSVPYVRCMQVMAEAKLAMKHHSFPRARQLLTEAIELHPSHKVSHSSKHSSGFVYVVSTFSPSG